MTFVDGVFSTFDVFFFVVFVDFCVSFMYHLSDDLYI